MAILKCAATNSVFFKQISTVSLTTDDVTAQRYNAAKNCDSVFLAVTIVEVIRTLTLKVFNCFNIREQRMAFYPTFYKAKPFNLSK